MRPPKFLIVGLAVVTVAAASVAAVRPAALFGQEMQMPTPGEEHEMLLKSAGEWTGTITMHMEGMPSMPNKATETVEAFGGFWTMSHFKCDFMGMSYEGRGSVGYDQMKKKYIGTWQDNMSSFLSVMEGDYDEDTNQMVMEWEAPTMSGEMAPHRSVMTHDENSYKMEFFLEEGGEETKTMTIEMKRKGAK